MLDWLRAYSLMRFISSENSCMSHVLPTWRAEVQRVLGVGGLVEMRQRRVDRLSMGEPQRVNLARMLVVKMLWLVALLGGFLALARRK